MYIFRHRTGQGSCTSFLTGQSSSVVSPTGGLQKCNDYLLHIFSTEKMLFSRSPVEVLSRQLIRKKQGTFLSFRGANPTPQTQKWGFVMRNCSQTPQNQKMHMKGKEHETAVKNNSAAVGLSSQLSTIFPYFITAAA